MISPRSPITSIPSSSISHWSPRSRAYRSAVAVSKPNAATKSGANFWRAAGDCIADNLPQSRRQASRK